MYRGQWRDRAVAVKQLSVPENPVDRKYLVHDFKNEVEVR